MTGSAFSLSAALPSEAFSVTRGEPVLGGLRGNPRHVFCPDCLSWLFTRVDGMDGFVDIRTTMLDDPAEFEPFFETWTSERLPWATTPARHALPGFPAMSDYAELTKRPTRIDDQAREMPSAPARTHIFDRDWWTLEIRAHSDEVDTGSSGECAANQEPRAAGLMQSGRIRF